MEKNFQSNDLELLEVFSDYEIDDESVAQQVKSEWLEMSLIKRGSQDLFEIGHLLRQSQTPTLTKVNNIGSNLNSSNLE